MRKNKNCHRTWCHEQCLFCENRNVAYEGCDTKDKNTAYGVQYKAQNPFTSQHDCNSASAEQLAAVK